MQHKYLQQRIPYGQHNTISIVGNKQNGLIKISSSQSHHKKFNIQFTIHKSKSSQIQYLISTTISKKKSQFSAMEKLCSTGKDSQDTQCMLRDLNDIEILALQITQDKQQAYKILNNAEQHSKDNQINIDKYIENYRVKQYKDLTVQFIKDMITHTLSSICIEQSEYEGYEFFGFCSNHQLDHIERKYSPLVLELLFKYNAKAALWLSQNFISLLEQKLFYSFRTQEWIPLPEHIQFLETYLKYLHEIGNFNSNELSKKINLVINVQNGLLNTLLLSEVNHLSEEINYRQTNKIHPTIIKMLTQCWKASSSRARVSSIYDESFTPDYYYHSINEKLEHSIGKIVWALKLIYQHMRVVKKYGDNFQKQSLQQLNSLSKVIHGYVLDDQRAKDGNFHSIIIQEKIKVYSKSIGYQSLLPYIYDISDVLPRNSIFNLTTIFGLTSLSQNHEKVSEKHDFRGNCHLYFNYKILYLILRKTIQNPKIPNSIQEGIKTLINSVQQKIISNYVDGVNEGITNFYSSWSPSGEGIKSENYLAIINTVFLADLNKIIPSNQKKDEPKLDSTKQNVK